MILTKYITNIAKNIQNSLRCFTLSPEQNSEPNLTQTKPMPNLIEPTNNLISASKTRNFALNDTLVDWLDLHFRGSSDKSKFSQTQNKPQQTSFLSYIMNKGIEFEREVMKLIIQKLPENSVLTICQNMENYQDRLHEYEARTKQAIRDGVPVIYQGVLINHTGPLQGSYGMPDMIVRSDYLHKLVDLDPGVILSKYVILDIKFTTLELCADGLRLRNSGSAPAYKCQLYIYNHALGEILGSEPTTSYILGRRYKYESRDELYSGDSCFDRLGHIQYDTWDKEYITKTIKAIEWIRRLRQHGSGWHLFPKPSIPELYPNMNNALDTHWSGVKKQYANHLGELTLLWNCGYKHRNTGHTKGVYSYKDKKCRAKILGINGPKIGKTLNKIIKINQKKKFKTKMDYIKVKLNKHLDRSYLKKSKLRITVDFETINSVMDDLSQLPYAQNSNYVFMIGVSTFADDVCNYRSFIITELTKRAEYDMVLEFYDYLRTLTDKYLGKNKDIPPLYHWGCIERTSFDKLCESLLPINSHRIVKINSSLCWYDMCEVFRTNPIVINGCFKFGLKEIANRLSELGLIKSKWDCSVSGGQDVMIIAQNIYKVSGNVKLHKDMIEIEKYNRIDCVVIHEIIDLLIKKVCK